jgi:glycine hydroxymethyltransferase
MAAYLSLLNPGDIVLGMNLSHGGHLTHGSRVNFSGLFYHFFHYGVNHQTGLIDYDDVEQKALHVKPKMIVAGASAYPRIIDFQRFAHIASSVNAVLMVDMAHIAGLVAAGYHPSPIPYADITTSTTHKTLRGPRGGLILAKRQYGEKLDKAVFPGVQGGPLMHIIAAKAVAFKEALGPDFGDYQKQVVKNARALAADLMEAGIKLISDGTDNHMMLADLSNLGITGKDAQDVLGRAGITVNKNAIPAEKLGPHITSGIRIGTPALTTRGMKTSEMAQVAKFIVRVLKKPHDETLIRRTRTEVHALCQSYPSPGNL